MFPPGLPNVGDVLSGKYRLVSVLGKGGVGVVYQADHLRLQSPVAVKFLLPEFFGDTQATARFEREGRAMARLVSPHVVRVFDVDQTAEGLPFVVMELLHGMDLHTLVKQKGALPIDVAVRYVRDACIGMAEAHRQGVIHRDLKPSNLYLSEDHEGNTTVKVVDFGISKIAGDDQEVTQTQAAIGTPSYMSPEQIMSSRDVDHRTDIWSLGIILYRLLANRLPFAVTGGTAMAVTIVTQEPDSLRLTAPHVPEDLARVIDRALAKKRDERFGTVLELAGALDNFLNTHGPAPAGPVSLPGAYGALSKSLSGAQLSTSMSGQFAAKSSSGEGPTLQAQLTNPTATTLAAPRSPLVFLVPGAIAVTIIVVGGVWFATRDSKTKTTDAAASQPTVTAAVEPPATTVYTQPKASASVAAEPPSQLTIPPVSVTDPPTKTGKIGPKTPPATPHGTPAVQPPPPKTNPGSGTNPVIL